MLVVEMAPEESVIVDGLMEVGMKLRSPPSDVGELLKLLDQAESFLVKVEQSPSQSISAALQTTTQSLVTKELLKHPDMDVKIATTACISEITRITAPEPPYDDGLMKEIFEMIVESLKGLDVDLSSRSYSKRVLILETIAKVRSCLVMLDLECDELILRMFHLFFKVIREIHEERIFKAMESIMTLVLYESEEISYDLAMCLLSNLRRDNKDISVEAKLLGERVLKNCSAILKPCLMEAIQFSGSHITDYHGIVASVCQYNNSKGSESCDVKVGTNAEKSSRSIASTNKINATTSVVQPTTAISSAPSKKKLMKKKGSSVSSPIAVETPDSERPKRGRPPGSKSHPKKESEYGKCSEAKQLSSSGRKKVNSVDDGHSKKGNYKGKQSNREINTNKDEGGVPNSKDLALDEKLIGSAIKVWWPEDKEFYEGVVDSFNPSTKKHRILYADGEEEVLLLKEERWEFVHSDSSNEEDYQDLSQSRPVKRRRKGKTKSVSAQRKASVQTPDRRGMPASKPKEDFTALGRRQGNFGSGKKSKVKIGSTSKEASRKGGKSTEEKNYDPGTPEVRCKLKDDASTPRELKDNLLNVESKSLDGVTESGCISDRKAANISSNPGDGNLSVFSKAVCGAVSSSEAPEDGNAQTNPKSIVEASS